MKIKEIAKIVWLPVVAASLCCLAPVILVLLGLSTVSFATSLTDNLYGDYKWVFRLLGLVLLIASVLIYFKKQKGVCSIDEAKRKRNEIINTSIIVLLVGIAGYVFWLYVVVEYIGKWLSIWG